MPAITGFIGLGSRVDLDSMLQKMVKCVVHEPFYKSGTYVNKELGLWIGWANIKGSFADDMPVWNEKEDIGLIFTGEDYRDAHEIGWLRDRGHRFTPGSASYLVHLYEEYGDEFLKKLNGRFSGMIIDLRQSKAVLFNDRYGLNRIYFHEKEGSFFFSSEAKSLLAILPETRQVDFNALAELFSLGCVLQNKTLYTGLALIGGGSAWTFQHGRLVRKSSYFDFRDIKRGDPLSHAAYYKMLKETWVRIIPRYFRGPERVGLSLTGGKDCRMILAWAGALPGSLPCYTFGGPYRDCYDVKIARRVAAACQQPHHVIRLDETFFRDFPRYAARTVFLTDGNMDIAGSPGLFVNSRAREIAPVRLTGNYGQEILRSYIAFKPGMFYPGVLDGDFARLMKNASLLYQEERRGDQLTFVAFKQVPWHHYARLASELSQVTLRSPYLDNEILELAYRAPIGWDYRDDMQLRLTAEGHAALGKIETDRGLLLKPVPVYSCIKNQFQEFTAKAEYAYDYGMPDALARIDHLCRMIHLERIFLGSHKYYHLRIWYRDKLASYVREMLLDPRTRQRPFLRGENISKMVNAHIRGVANYTSEINRLLTVEILCRQLIEPGGQIF